jgi:hypothetical protein
MTGAAFMSRLSQNHAEYPIYLVVHAIFDIFATSKAQLSE